MKLITCHVNADFDSLASMIAAQQIYPDAVMAFPGSQEKSVRRFISETLQYHYTFNKAKDIDLTAVDTLILIDTRHKERIGDFAKCLKNPGISLHLYDHHPDQPNCLQGDVEHVKQLGATTTIFCQLFQEQKLAISPETATIFALGIYEDTGSLTYLTTTPEDLMAAAWLVGQGAKLEIVTQFLSFDLTSRQIELIHKLTQHAKSYVISGIQVIVASLPLEEYEDDFSIIVRRVMLLENLDCLFALVSMEGRVYLIARSRIAEVNTGTIARDFGGGGHASAASATIRNMTLVEAHEHLIRSLHRHVSPRAIAEEMLSRPVISIPPHTTIQEANNLLTRYNITVLPVLTEENSSADNRIRVVGTIARRITEKAIHHNLGAAPVSDYMTSDLRVLPLTATLAEIEELIIEHRQRLIPIIHEKELVGVITRTDLLSRLTGDPGHTPQELIQDSDYPSRNKRRNVLQLMSEVLDKKLIMLLQTIGEIAEKSGFRAYSVGGFVRDLLLKQKNLDLDIVIEGDGIIFARKLAKTLGGRITVHDRFITANIRLADGFKIDIATARLEYYDYPAALPTVELSSLKLDLYRRDFSINAMAIELNPIHFGTLIDFFNCQNDLKNRLIKVLHNLSFVEDPSRVLRAIRFEKRLNFKIDRHTDRLIRNSVKSTLFTKGSTHRIFSELQQIFSEENPILAIQRLEEFHLFQFLWPDLKPNLKIDRYFRHTLTQARRAISWFRLLYLEENNEINPWRIYLLTIMSRSKPTQLESFCKRFQIQQKVCSELIQDKLRVEEVSQTWHRQLPDKNSLICKSLCTFNNDMLLYFMAISRKTDINRKTSLYVTTLRDVQPLVNGEDLKELGYTPGKIFKEMLRYLRNAQLDNTVTNRQDAIEFITDHFPLETNNSP